MSLRRPARVAAAAALSAVALLAAACSSSSSSSSGSSTSGAAATPINVSMGIEPWIGYAPWYIAQAKGYFTKHGLNVNIVNFETDADRNSALIAGRTNVSNIDTGRTIQFASKGLPAVPLLLVDDSNGADAIMSVKSLTTPQQLVGQSVSYEFGTTSDLLLHYLLVQNHIPFTSITSVNVPAANAGTLLIAGKTKVAVTYQPYISEATSNPAASNVHVFYSSAQAPGLISDFLVANKSWLASNPTAAKDLVLAWQDAIAYYKSNPTDAIAIMAKGIGATPASLAPVLPGVILYSVPDNLKLVASGQLAEEYTKIGETLKAMGQITTIPTLGSVANFSFLK
jgi:NitT/TauT family transport system substrate-binding protein